jgi:ATP phosphoribosyltransferase regulatory subunit
VSKPFAFEKPLGMRDILPEMVYRKQHVLQLIQRQIDSWGYELIETPTLEYYETVGEHSATESQRLFKVLDRSGRTLVLRPDMTAPIARVVSSLLKDRPFPVRLAYQGNVFRAQELEAGRNAEFPEVGIELIGEEAPDADAEVIALAVESLQAVGVRSFKVAIGHIGLLNALFREVLPDEKQVEALQSYLNHKNVVGYRAYVEQAEGQGALSRGQRQALLSLLEWRGGLENIQKAEAWLPGEHSRQALHDLLELWEVLRLHGVEEHVLFDLSLISHKDYYTGIFFEGYADQLGFPLASGGRYDHLLAEFGRSAPATGFALKLDRILEAATVPVQERPQHREIVYVTEEREEAFREARTLRAQGYTVSLHRHTGKHSDTGSDTGQQRGGEDTGHDE